MNFDEDTCQLCWYLGGNNPDLEPQHLKCNKRHAHKSNDYSLPDRFLWQVFSFHCLFLCSFPFDRIEHRYLIHLLHNGKETSILAQFPYNTLPFLLVLTTVFKGLVAPVIRILAAEIRRRRYSEFGLEYLGWELKKHNVSDNKQSKKVGPSSQKVVRAYRKWC